MSSLPPILVELRASSRQFSSTMDGAQREIKKLGRDGGQHLAKLGVAGKAALIGITTSAVSAGAIALRMGANFQTSITALQTGAGESAKNLKTVGDGILSMAGKVGLTADELAAGMYNIESAGYHGAQGLTVLQTAAQGAKVGQADMAVVADALTSALNAYGAGAEDSARYTNTLIATVAAGKMKMNDLAASLGQVLPVASAAHVGLQEVGAAIATMTAQGTPAQVATTRLASLMTSLQNPSATAIKLFKDFGISSTAVADTLTHHGLHAALELVTETVGKKFPAGSAQYTAAVAAMVGGNDQLKAALNLTGGNAKTFAGNIAGIAKNVHDAGGQVKGWSEVQKTFNQKLSQSTASLGAVSIRIGTVLIPVVTRAAAKVAELTEWFSKHRTTALALAGVIGGALVLAITAYVGGLVWAAGASVVNFVKMILLGEEFAATQEASFGKAIAAAIRWVAVQTAAAVRAAASLVASFATQIAAAAVWAASMVAAGAMALLPFLPIIAAVAAVGFAAYELYKHWDAVWGFVTKITGDAWNFIKQHAALIVGAIFLIFPPLGILIATVHLVWKHWSTIWGAIRTATAATVGFLRTVLTALVRLGLVPIRIQIAVLRAVWSAAWGAIRATASAAWGVLKPIFNAVVRTGLWALRTAISQLKSTWNEAWNAISDVVSAVWDTIRPILEKVSGAISTISGGLGKIGGSVSGGISGVGHMLGFADGGYVPGARGAAQLAVVHGGEYVVSNDMQSGRAPYGGPGFGGGGGGGGVAEVQVALYLDGKVIHQSNQTQEIRYKSRNGRASS